MKKYILCAAIAAVFCVSIALAGSTAVYAQGGGFTGPGGTVNTVAEAKNMPDDSPVTLTGKIEKSLGGDKYQFRDKSGTLVLEIDNDDWNGVTVGENDLVEIIGEVDKDFSGLTIDVDRVVKK
jgi:uncharacterized protein (TIGR00156 family)